jgi:hypothetical protein
MKNLTILVVLVIGILTAVIVATIDSKNNGKTDVHIPSSEVPRAFIGSGLQTNTAVSSIDLEMVLDGGPGKDGIPALTDPTFVDVDAARDMLEPTIRGIFLSFDGEKRFYPYNIMVWHEVVNDIVGNTPVLVTFCPLCGTAIVFDPVMGGQRHLFGVSGKLYESNLLMYDEQTESLWSQAIGDAVVGERTGTTLSYLPMQLITFADILDNHPDAKVLSEDTGYSRNYNRYPYGDYDSNDVFIFPVSVSDTRLPSKELIYAVNAGTDSLAIAIQSIEDDSSLNIELGPFDVSVERTDSAVTVRNAKSGDSIPGYYSMWFSWATHHQDNGYVWTGE